MVLKVLNADWDVIVIGSGVGGGLVSRRLTELGLRVLIIEKGRNFGDTASAPLSSSSSTPSARLDDGWWPQPIVGQVGKRTMELENVIGAGVGGTSLRYAATLERPEPADLDHSLERPHPTGGWPVSYAEFAPYFRMAEEYFCISGELDPLVEAPDPLPYSPRTSSPGERRFSNRLRTAGLHPYQTHMAARFVPGCESCFGTRCPKRCKMDGRSAGVLHALASGSAEVLDNCTVLSIDAGDNVTSIACRKDGQDFQLSARAYVLAAGGLGSPSLLLRSKSEAWPDGLGNRHGLVGRNLMFHLSEIMAVWTADKSEQAEPAQRSISFRDLYHEGRHRMGLVQTMGIKAGYGEVLYAAQMRLATSAFGKFRPLRHALRIPAYVAAKILGPAHLFVGVLEDFPSPENRVIAHPSNPDRLEFRYAFTDELEGRRQTFRRAMSDAFAGFRHAFMSREPQLNFAHPCGTVRFGLDPRSSVLDRDCRMHGVDNLFVVDSSFMPTSNGVNPSLTIGANALRVAERMASALRGKGVVRALVLAP
jgi:choline dehydrogenase-like flavoprotein